MLYFILRDDAACLRAFLDAHIKLLGKETPFFGLAGTAHETMCAEMGIKFVPEIYCDIDYDAQGKLLGVPLSAPANPDKIARKLQRVLASQESEHSPSRFWKWVC